MSSSDETKTAKRGRSPAKDTHDVPVGHGNAVAFYFEDGTIKNAPYNAQKNLAQFLTTVLTARGLSLDSVTLKDQGTKQIITWNVNSTFADLPTHAVTVHVKEDKKASKEREKELLTSSSTQVPTVTVSSSDSTDTSDYSSSTSEKKTPEKRPRKTSNTRRQRRRSHSRKQSEEEAGILAPLSESSSDLVAAADAITFYFGTGEFKRIPNNQQKRLEEVLDNFARTRAFSLDSVKLVDHTTGKSLNWDSDSVFGDFQTITFGIMELSEKEIKKIEKKGGKSRCPAFRRNSRKARGN